MTDKPFRDMTTEELTIEFEKWDEKVRSATGWDAAYVQALKWRDQCERILKERER